jgi:UDP-3-O-[3-hydroxymyristoyl] N-acetylglucosamine deacetylase
MKVLVVDDNHCLASIIREILEDEGFDVVTAKDGIDGYSAYLLFEPDLIITDIQMPRKNGLEMMACIRTHNPMIQTVYMSGDINSFRASLLEEEKKYPVSFFEKPFSMGLLKQFVSRSPTEPIPKMQFTDIEAELCSSSDALAELDSFQSMGVSDQHKASHKFPSPDR